MRIKWLFCIAIGAIFVTGCDRKDAVAPIPTSESGNVNIAGVDKVSATKQPGSYELVFRPARPADYPLIARIGQKELDPTSASVATFDLDSDGGADLIVVAGRGWCGTLGCATWIVFRTGSLATSKLHS